jgi:hypothetical protein
MEWSQAVSLLLRPSVSMYQNVNFTSTSTLMNIYDPLWYNTEQSNDPLITKYFASNMLDVRSYKAKHFKFTTLIK